MKKLIYCALAFAAGLFATSCQQENLEPVAGENYTVTYTVEAPMDAQTKAIADGLNVNELIYEVWWTSADGTIDLTDAQRLYQAKTVMAPIEGVNKGTVTLNLVKDQHYTILFWAQKKGTGVYNTTDLVNVYYNNLDPEAYYANDDALAAFYAVDFVNDGIAKNSKVYLKRPFAQVNLATLNERDPKNNTEEHPLDYSITLVNSKMTLNKVPTQFNVATSEVKGDAVIEFKYNGVPSTAVAHTTATGAEYYYAGMNYVFAGANLELTYQIQTRLNGSEALAEITNTIPNVPVRENYRTNIVGNLLTSKTEYEVIVDAGFNTNDKPGNIEVVGEGIVKNMDGDYEVTSARGFAYALTYIMGAEKQGTDPLEVRNFYLHDNFDMTGVPFTSPTIPAGVKVNIIGEVPVVTRSTSMTFGSVVITGLTQPLIAKVEGEAFISGVEIPAAENTVSVLINEVAAEATVYVEDVEATTIVNNGTVTNASDVQDYATLKKVLEKAEVTNINITADIEAEDIVFVDKSVVINGNDFTLTTAANRAIRVTTSEIEVTINDLNIVSNAVMTYPNDVRGISIDANLSDVSLTLNECTIDFTDKTTNDWTYAVNVSGNGTGHKVTVNGGTYEGANVVNVHGAKNTVIVKNATLNCLYPTSDTYYGACIWVLQNQESSVYAEGNTFNGYNAVAFNLGTGTALEEMNNTDNTMYYSDGAYYVASAEKLQAAIDNAKEGTNTIILTNNIVGDVTVIQKKGVKITIEGEEYKYNGSIKVHSNSNYYADSGITVKNVNFETSTASVNVIEALENGSERYSSNITVEDCTFTATGEAVNTSVAVQVKATRGVTVIGCTATNMHSLIQAQSCDTGDVKVVNCTVNGKNGVAFKQVKSAIVEGTTITALEYGIRFDGNIDNYGIVVKGNNVTAVQPLIVRKMTAKDNTIALEGTNTLTTESDYQVVITNGSDDEEYVKPTGTYTLTGAEGYTAFPKHSK